MPNNMINNWAKMKTVGLPFLKEQTKDKQLHNLPSYKKQYNAAESRPAQLNAGFDFLGKQNIGLGTKLKVGTVRGSLEDVVKKYQKLRDKGVTPEKAQQTINSKLLDEALKKGIISAQRGVDSMNKVGYLDGYLDKRAGLGGEVINQLLTGVAVPPAGALVNLAGMTGGAVAETPEKWEARDSAANQLYNLIPGRGAYAQQGRIKRSLADSKAIRDDVKDFNAYDEMIGGPGGTLSTLGNLGALGALGAGVGAMSDGESGAAKGAMVGLGAGAASLLAASVLAMLKKRRTKEDQAEVDADPNRFLKRLLIPGLGTYDSWKRLGSTKEYDRDSKEEKRMMRKNINPGRSYDEIKDGK